jgi:hypothetical protein
MVRTLQDHTVEPDLLALRMRHLEDRVRQLEEQIRSLTAVAAPPAQRSASEVAARR